MRYIGSSLSETKNKENRFISHMTIWTQKPQASVESAKIAWPFNP